MNKWIWAAMKWFFLQQWYQQKIPWKRYLTQQDIGVAIKSDAGQIMWIHKLSVNNDKKKSEALHAKIQCAKLKCASIVSAFYAFLLRT